MPSLSALKEFRNSFSNIANEREDVASRNLPYTSLDLPTTEAPPFEQFSREAAPARDSQADTAGDSLADSTNTGADAGIDNFDFNAFLNSIPTDVPPAPDSDTAPPADEVLPPSDGLPSSDDLPVSEDLLSTEEPPTADDFLDSLGSEPLPADSTSGETPADEALSDDDLLNSLGSEPSSADSTSGEISADKAPPAGDLNTLESETPSDTSFPADDFLDSIGTEPPTKDDASPKPDDDFSVPADLLSGLSDEIESAPADFTPEESPSEDEGHEETMDLGDEGQDDSLSTDIAAKDFLAPEDSAAFDDLPDTGVSDTGVSDTPLSDISYSDDALADNAPEPSPQDTEPEVSGSPLDTDTSVSDTSVSDTSVSDTPVSEMPSSDFELPEIDLSETSVPDKGGDEESIDMGGETLDDGVTDNFDNLPETDLNTEVSPTEDFGFDSENSLSDTGLPDETEFTQTEPEGVLPDMDFAITEEPSASDSPADDSSGLPEISDLGGDFASESIELENKPESESEAEPAQTHAAVFSDDDFALPGIDDLFEKSKTVAAPQPAPKKGFFKRKKEEPAEEEHESEDSDEIQLSQSDVDKLLATLATYPLNLRVACEELIAEQVILPKQLSKLLRMLIKGAHVKEMAEFAGQILGKAIVIPKSYEKSTGAEWEAERSSFAYIFVNNFLPVLRIVAFALALLFSTGYLVYKFIYTPIKAESLYRRGYERIGAGEYQRANELFHEAFVNHRKKKWFYAYAEGFRDQRRYLLAENKYDELLRYYPRDKKGVLDYANLETNYLLNYEKANRLLQHELLDYAPNDYDGLLAAGDNFLAWADSDPSKFYDKYEDARFAYARILQDYGWTGPVVERMLLYFIHTDNLKETLNLRAWFENNSRKYKLSTPSLAELGGYLLDKQLEKVKGVPNAYVESIESVRDMLLQAVKQDSLLPEPHYHLARYYKNLGNVREERLTLENAIRAYDLAKKESVRRRLNRIDTHYRYANLLINNKEFFPAEEQLVKGIELYNDFISRNLIAPSPQLGQLYAGLGDLEYFVKSGNMQTALNNYHAAEKYGWSPPEIQYRMGAAYYQQEKWGNALDYLFKAASALPLNRRILFALGNTAYKRGDYFAAQGYYNRLLDILENQRVRLPVLFPNDSPQFLELGERLMMARNNAGVTYEALAKQSGRREYRSRALSLYADSARAWDSITRNPQSMTRMSIGDTPGAPGINLGYLNANNALHPSPGFNPEIFIRIDRDVSEPSHWEELAPFGGLID